MQSLHIFDGFSSSSSNFFFYYHSSLLDSRKSGGYNEIKILQIRRISHVHDSIHDQQIPFFYCSSIEEMENSFSFGELN